MLLERTEERKERRLSFEGGVVEPIRLDLEF